MKNLLVIDGNSLINRAFYGVPLLSTKEGIFTNAVYGFLNILVKAITENKPDYIIVAFDHARKTFRNELYSEYKAGRKQMPEELRGQFDILKEVLKACNIKVIEQAGIEADDIIGTVTKRFSENSIIVTGDRDSLQLIDDKITVWLTKKGISDVKRMDSGAVVDDFGVEPCQIIDLKALMGDKSDNIPGVRGIGEVGAVKLLNTYKTLEGVYENIDEIKGATKTKLVDNKDMAFLSKQLATIKLDCEIDCDYDDCTYDFPFKSEVFKLFKKYEFSNLLKRKELFTEVEDLIEKRECRKEVLSTNEEVENFVEFLKKQKEFSFVLEPLCFATKECEYVINFTNDLFGASIDIDKFLADLKPVFEDENILKCVYDYKETKKVLLKKNINLCGCFDVALAKYLLEANDKNQSLKQFAIETGFEDNYASSLVQLKKELTQRLKNEGLYSLYEDLEYPLSDVLISMEKEGIKLDEEKLKEASEKYEKELIAVNEDILALAGKDFNVNSSKQLAEVLFDELKIPCQYNKSRSTAIDVLNSLLYAHPIIPLIIRYRKIQKLKSTYIDAFIKLIDNGFIHTVFNQMATATGRLSSKDPNMQNLPTRDEESKLIRQMFVSRFEGGKIVSADYSQIELKLIAHFSEDENMLETFRQGKDIHTATAAKIYGISEDEVTKQQRREAKAVNFGIVYGQSAFGLATSLGIGVKAASQFMEAYFKTYPKVKEYMETSIVKAKENGNTALTLLGRKRKIPELSSSNHNLKSFGERVAMNMPLQGSASDIIKLAMVNISRVFKQENLKSKLILQIHDELVIDTTSDEVEKVKEILKSEMENAVNLSLKLLVEVGVGDNLYDSK